MRQIAFEETGVPSALWLLCFATTTLLFVGFSANKLGGGDTVLVPLALILIYLFTSGPKLKPELDLIFALLILSAVGIAASSISRRPEISFDRLVLYRDVIFIGFCYYVLLKRGLVSNVSAVYLGVILGFLCVMPQTLFEYFMFSAQPEMSGQRFVAPKLTYYGHIRHFSYHAFFAACCATLLARHESVFRYVTVTLAAVCVIALVASTGRAAILAYLVFIFLLLRREFSALKISAILAFLALAIVGVLVILSFTPAASLTESIILRSQQLTNPDQLLSGRIGFWKNALASIKDSPLLGLGPEGYRWSLSVPQGVRQPHNSFVQLAVEFGYLGAAIVLVTFARVTIPRISKFHSRDPATTSVYTGVSAILVAAFVYSLVDGVFYHFLPLIHVAVLAAVWFAAVNESAS